MSSKHEKQDPFEADTDRAFRLPKPTPEKVDDGTDDAKKADSDNIDDLEIEVDTDELEAETESDRPGRKY